jgi:hypothetical protein
MRARNNVMMSPTRIVRYLLCLSALLVCATVRAQTAHPTGNFGTRDFSVEFWMQTPVQQNAVLVGKREICNLGPGWNVSMGYVNGESFPGNVGLEIITSDAAYSAAATTVHISDGRWHQVVLTRLHTIVSIYVDGMQRASVTIPATTDMDNSVPLQVGRTVCEGAAGIDRYRGKVADLAIYNRALSAFEISAMYYGAYNKSTSHFDSQTLHSIRKKLQRVYLSEHRQDR